MNISKTNPLGLKCIEEEVFLDIFKNSVKKNRKSEEGTSVNSLSPEQFKESTKTGSYVRETIFKVRNSKCKILRVSKSIVDSCRLVEFDSIAKNIDNIDFGFSDFIVLLNNDTEGIIKVSISGSDIDFLFIKNPSGKPESSFNTFSFLTKEFYIHADDNCRFVIKLLSYLFYGDITMKKVLKKGTIKISSFSKFLNKSKYDIIYADSNWKQRVSSDGFKVRGHFRLQPFGKKLSKKKLIWIEEFNKDGYNRRATREINAPS